MKLHRILLPTLCFLFQVNYSIADPAQDTLISIDVLTKAAEQGIAMAQFNVGEFYRTGSGVTQDYVQAYKWFSLAASVEGGKREAAAKLRDLVAGQMTPEQMLQARQLVMEWETAHPQSPTASRGMGGGIGTGIGGGIGTGAGFGVGTGSGRGGSVAGSGPYTVGPDVKAPVQLVHPQPSYTDAARNSRIEGTVVFQCIIRKDGTADTFRILQGLGYGLDESAIKTVSSQWRFRPGTFKGNPVDLQATIYVLFKLY